MANAFDFSVGTVFGSYIEFQLRLAAYEKQEKANFRIDTSCLLKVKEEILEEKRITEHEVLNFHYKYAKFMCKFGGSARQTTAQRQRNTSTFRQECKASFSIGFRKNQNGTRLVTKVANEHNHVRSADSFKVMPKQRRQTIDEASPYLKHVINVKPNFQLLQNDVPTSSKEKGVVKRWDLHNYTKRNGF